MAFCYVVNDCHPLIRNGKRDHKKKSIPFHSYFCVRLGIAVFVRPELFLSWIIAVFFSIIVGFKSPIKNRLIDMLVGFCPITLLTLIFGVPVTGGRSLVAFGQHYAVHYVKAHNLNVDPWNNWHQIFSIDFNGATGILSAAIINPAAFFNHIFNNIKQLYWGGYQLLPSLPISKTQSLFVGLLLLVLLMLGIVLGLYFQAQRSGLRVKSSNTTFSFIAIAFLIVAFPSIISTVVIFPSTGYFRIIFIPTLMLSILGWGLLLSKKEELALLLKKRSAFFAAFVVLLLLIAPGRTSFKPALFTFFQDQKQILHQIFRQ